MTKTVHIVGGGLSGLSAAVHAKSLGFTVKLYEASPQLGGRIKKVSHHDNGTHLLVGAYRDSFEYLDMIGTRDQLKATKGGCFSMSEGPLTWDIPAHSFFRSLLTGAVPGVNAFNLFGKTAQRRVWTPLILAIYNTRPSCVSRKLVWQTAREVLRAGQDGLTPYLAIGTLYDAFVAPALAGIDVITGARLQGVEADRLQFKTMDVVLNGDNRAILALPLSAYRHINHPLDIVHHPDRPITNVHFYLEQPVGERFFGLVNTLSQWVHAKDKMISVTISDYQPNDDKLAQKVWREICFHFDKAETNCPDHRIVCEKRATPLQDKGFCKVRRAVKTDFPHIFMAGDWTETKLPATIESAVRSGKMAAQSVFG
ncbi:hydroxysqualene dehydroxylase [Terasakiella pusilla]|uniref:hydroxysqualene dehydroxylase n=1 Tax=Terasakiella pusilla TaxID=64973 RepID=UPI003AA80514